MRIVRTSSQETKEGWTIVEMSPKEAIDTIKSLSNQLSSGRVNQNGREEVRTKDGWFTIMVLPPGAPSMTLEMDPNVESAISSAQMYMQKSEGKILFIREIRRVTGLGLRAVKPQVDATWDEWEA